MSARVLFLGVKGSGIVPQQSCTSRRVQFGFRVGYPARQEEYSVRNDGTDPHEISSPVQLHAAMRHYLSWLVERSSASLKALHPAAKAHNRHQKPPNARFRGALKTSQVFHGLPYTTISPKRGLRP